MRKWSRPVGVHTRCEEGRHTLPLALDKALEHLELLGKRLSQTSPERGHVVPRLIR